MTSDKWKQVIWEMLTLMGLDTDGDPTPAAVVNLKEVALRTTTMFIDSYCRELDELDMTQSKLQQIRHLHREADGDCWACGDNWPCRTASMLADDPREAA